MNLQEELQDTFNSSHARVRNSMQNFTGSAPFTVPFTVLQREITGTKTFAANELYEKQPSTDNTKTVKTFSKNISPSHMFVTMAAPTGRFELLAVNKQTGLATERLVQTFPSHDAANQYVSNIAAKNKK